jgi:hypothetical protein
VLRCLCFVCALHARAAAHHRCCLVRLLTRGHASLTPVQPFIPEESHGLRCLLFCPFAQPQREPASLESFPTLLHRASADFLTPGDALPLLLHHEGRSGGLRSSWALGVLVHANFCVHDHARRLHLRRKKLKNLSRACLKPQRAPHAASEFR